MDKESWSEEDPRNGDLGSEEEEPCHKKPKLDSRALIIPLQEPADEFAHHQPDVARINNGSFGCCPASVIAAQRQWQLRFLQQPDDFYFNRLKHSLLHSRHIIKNLINADHVDQISLIDNATTAAAIVLQHLSFSSNPRDVVLIFSCAFQSVKKSIKAYFSRTGGDVVEVRLPFPVSSNHQILHAFKNGLLTAKAGGRNIRLAIIDHITSMPCVLLPVPDLVKLCRQQGVDQVFVDAAHAIGSVPIDVNLIGADFYVSNLHKWFFCPPSVAFFYCRKSTIQVHHPVVSHEYGNGLPIESGWIGTRDYSSQLVVPSALDFVNRFEGGIHGIMKWNHQQVVKMGNMLADSWGTDLGSPPDMCPGMIMVGLPSRLGVNSEQDASRLRTHLRVQFSVEVPIYFEGLKDGEDVGPKDKEGFVTAYARISHQIYNKLEDYVKFRDAIHQLLQDQVVCSMLSRD